MASTAAPGASNRGAPGSPSTSGSFAWTQARRDADARRSHGADRSSRSLGTSPGGKKSAEAAADTLDKLLNELVNASAQRVRRSGVGGRSERRGGTRDRWSAVLGLGSQAREKRRRQPTDWLLEFAGASSAGAGEIDAFGVFEDASSDDDSGDVPRDVPALDGTSAFPLRDTFDETTDAIYRASLASLTRSSRCGVYRDTGLGVGHGACLVGANSRGFGNGARDGVSLGAAGGGGSRDAASSASTRKTTDSSVGDAALQPRGGFSSPVGAGGAVGASLREHVEAEARDTSSEAFAKYARDMHRRIRRLIQSPEVSKRLAGVYAVDVLTDAKIGETANKMNRFASYLRDVFSSTCEPVLAEAAARAVGKIVRVGGALTAGIADREVKRCVLWLRADSSDASSAASSGSERSGGEARRYAAVLVLRELAEHAPEVFNVHISSFIDAVWPALRDSRLFVRQAAVRALRACLVVIERRETRYRVQWYYRLYEETQIGLSRPFSASESGGGLGGASALIASPARAGGERRAFSPGAGAGSSATRRANASGSTVTQPGSVESQHGSLLAFGELLRHTGEFMLSRYKEVAETVLGLHQSREKIVRRATLELVPKLAAFSPKRFTESYLERSMRLLLSCLKNQAERDAGFTAIGDVAAALAAADEGETSSERVGGHPGAGRAAAAAAGAYGSPGGSPRWDVRAGAGARDALSFGDDHANSSGGGLRFKGTAASAAPEERGGGASDSARDGDASARLASASDAERARAQETRAGRTHRRSGSGFGFVGSLARIASQSSVRATSSSDNLRRADNQKPLERYLPEIAAATRETCAAMEKAYAAAAIAPPTKSGLRPAPAREPGVAEAFLCVGALAKSVGAPWEPHARALMPFLFAGGLTAPLVAALASLAQALPRTAPMVQERLVAAISEALSIGVGLDVGARGNGESPASKRAPEVARAELVGARFGGDEGDARRRALGGSVDGNGRRVGESPKSPLGSTGSFSRLRRAFSSALLGDGEADSARGDAEMNRIGDEPNRSLLGASTPGRASRLGVPPAGGSFSGQTPPPGSVSVSTPAAAMSTPGSPKMAGAKKKSADRKADERDAAALKVHRARVQLALRTLGTFPFSGAAGAMSLGYARKRTVEFLDDDDAATRREAALACCRLLDSRTADGSRTGGGGVAPFLAKPGGWSASVEECIVSRLLAVAVSDLDAGVRKAVLASFCKPSAATDGHLAQAESLRVLFVALNDENAEVRLIAIQLVGRLAPRNPAYALPALRRHLLQLLAELEHSAESHIREESARLTATLARAVPRLVAPYIAPVLRALVAKLRARDARGAKAGAGRDARLKNAAAAPPAAGGARGDGEGDDAGDGRAADAVAAEDAIGWTALGADAASDGRRHREAKRSGGGDADLRGDLRAEARARDDGVGGAPVLSAGAANAPAERTSSARHAGRERAAVPARERAAVLGAVGEIAQIGAEGVRAYAETVLPLVADAARSGATRAAAVVALGQWVEATGSAVRPFAEHPHLLRLLLRVLAEESGETRAQTLRTLGVLGALDPLAHKENEERRRGQGLLSMEGVRGVGRDAADDLAVRADRERDRADAPGGSATRAGDAFASDDERLRRGARRVGGALDEPDDVDVDDDVDDDAAAGGDVGSGDPIPTRHLTTASDAFYPSVALNALLRVLRDPSASSRHHAVTRSITYIFRALGQECVPYLPATVPVILRVIRDGEDSSREFMYAQLVTLVGVVKGHIRRYLEDIFDVIRRFWGGGPLLRQSLRLLEALAAALHDDFREFLPEILPRVVGVLADAERSGEHEAVPATLRALESFGSAADEHLHLVLPSLVRLFRPQVAASVPTPVRARTLRSLAALLPRAQLAGHASAVAHPLLRVLDGDVDELRQPALAALAAMALSLRDDFALFVPMTRRVMEKRNVRDPVFERVADAVERRARLDGGRATSEAARAADSAFAPQPPLATATSGSALPNPLGPAHTMNAGFANLALRASREAEAMRELSLDRSGGAAGPGPGPGSGRRTPPPDEPVAGDSVYRGGSHRAGEGSHYGGRSPELDASALFSPSQGLTAPFGDGRTDFAVDEHALLRAWDSSSRSTKEDWLEWARRVSVETLRQSPSPALRACLELASTRPRTARDLFCASFASCWSGLSSQGRDALVRAIESAFGAPTIPPEIVGTLLNLAEFCEHDERPLPLEARALGAIAERCRAYAKALHYKETEFVTSPAACVEAIIAINNRLNMSEAAMGVLVYAQAHLRLEIKEGWYEKLGQWENALDAHRRKAAAAEAAARDADASLEEASKDASSSDLGDRGGSLGRRRGAVDAETTGPASSVPSFSRRGSVARRRAALRARESAAEARREATLGQMRCLAALAEWEALGRLCAREWAAGEAGEARAPAGLGAGPGPSAESPPPEPGNGARVGSAPAADAALRARMAPLATQAAWHLGDWRRMETYCAAIPAPADAFAPAASGGPHRPDGLDDGVFAADGAGSGLGPSWNASDDDSPTSLAGGGVAVDVEFFRAVLATRRGDAEEARVRIRAAREHLGKELAALVSDSYDRSYGGMVRAQQLTELEEVLEYAELGRVVEAADASAGEKDGAPLAGPFAETANVGDARSARTRRALMREMWRERIYGVQRKVEVWQALLAVRALALPMREETETWLKFASLNRKAGRARQAHRTLLRLLDYDPSRCAPGSPGYGAGSGQPNVMLAYVKHQWALGNRRDAFARLQSLVGELRCVDARRRFAFDFVRVSGFLDRARMMMLPKD